VPDELTRASCTDPVFAHCLEKCIQGQMRMRKLALDGDSVTMILINPTDGTIISNAQSMENWVTFMDREVWIGIEPLYKMAVTDVLIDGVFSRPAIPRTVGLVFSNVLGQTFIYYWHSKQPMQKVVPPPQLKAILTGNGKVLLTLRKENLRRLLLSHQIISSDDPTPFADLMEWRDKVPRPEHMDNEYLVMDVPDYPSVFTLGMARNVLSVDLAEFKQISDTLKEQVDIAIKRGTQKKGIRFIEDCLDKALEGLREFGAFAATTSARIPIFLFLNGHCITNLMLMLSTNPSKVEPFDLSSNANEFLSLFSKWVTQQLQLPFSSEDFIKSLTAYFEKIFPEDMVPSDEIPEDDLPEDDGSRLLGEGTPTQQRGAKNKMLGQAQPQEEHHLQHDSPVAREATIGKGNRCKSIMQEATEWEAGSTGGKSIPEDQLSLPGEDKLLGGAKDLTEPLEQRGELEMAGPSVAPGEDLMSDLTAAISGEPMSKQLYLKCLTVIAEKAPRTNGIKCFGGNLTTHLYSNLQETVGTELSRMDKDSTAMLQAALSLGTIRVGDTLVFNLVVRGMAMTVEATLSKGRKCGVRLFMPLESTEKHMPLAASMLSVLLQPLLMTTSNGQKWELKFSPVQIQTAEAGDTELEECKTLSLFYLLWVGTYPHQNPLPKMTDVQLKIEDFRTELLKSIAAGNPTLPEVGILNEIWQHRANYNYSGSDLDCLDSDDDLILVQPKTGKKKDVTDSEEIVITIDAEEMAKSFVEPEAKDDACKSESESGAADKPAAADKPQAAAGETSSAMFTPEKEDSRDTVIHSTAVRNIMKSLNVETTKNEEKAGSHPEMITMEIKATGSTTEEEEEEHDAPPDAK